MLSLSMIVKNEENHLETALKSVEGIDEIVISDTGSEDKTVEIAKKYTDKIYTDYKWNDNFAEARNYVLSKCSDGWILILDADEVLETPMDIVKKTINEVDKLGIKAILCKTISEKGGETHNSIRLFKKCDEIYWKGAIHNYLSITDAIISDIVIKYGYSDSHKKDPDRTLRILKKEVLNNPKLQREKYYLAREYWYRSDFKTALYWYEEYLKIATWLPERADAYFMASQCYWNLQNGNKAREYCLKAIEINANFKQALKFMATLSWEKNAKKWLQFAELADNSDVLFIRN